MRDDLSELNFSKKYNPTFDLHTSDVGYRHEHEQVDGDGPFLTRGKRWIAWMLTRNFADYRGDDETMELLRVC